MADLETSETLIWERYRYHISKDEKSNGSDDESVEHKISKVHRTIIIATNFNWEKLNIIEVS